MTSETKRRFYKIFGPCFLPCNGELPSQDRKKQQHANDSSQWQQQNDSYARIQRSFSTNQLYNDQLIWSHQDHKQRNSSSESNRYSSTVATTKVKNEKITTTPTSTARSNRLYYVIENPKSTSVETKKKPQTSTVPTRTINTSHVRRPPRPPLPPPPIVKPSTNISTATRTTTRIPTVRVNPPAINQKTVPSSSTTNKSSVRPRYALPKPSPTPVVSTPTRTQPTVSPPKPIKTRIPIPPSQSRRVTDLDKALAERQKAKQIRPALFTPQKVKVVRPIKSQELKIFSCHLTPETAKQTTPTPKNELKREFSEDSLNEHAHVPKIVQQTSGIVPISSTSTVLSTSTLPKPSSPTTTNHRLVFPNRLGRLIFYRPNLSDTDIYRKNCSKDHEILHNVYHLDTVRDYSMDFYMLTTYASDSQLRAWLDDEDADEFLRFNYEQTPDSIDNVHQQTELDWCSELELLQNDQTSTCSSDIHLEEFSPNTSDDSTRFCSTPLPTEQTNTILHEILNHSWPDDASIGNETDPTSSIIADEFQSDFYYLCPITKTTSFTMSDAHT